MENTQFPIVIKKRNGFMIGVSILEIFVGLVTGMTTDGIKSPILWIFVFVGIITALSVLVEYNQDIYLKENKVEFYKNNDLIKEIKYSNINTLSISKGKDSKSKKKDFFAISYSEGKKSSKDDNYLINPMNYGAEDLKTIKNTILKKNPSVKVQEEVDNFIK